LQWEIAVKKAYMVIAYGSVGDPAAFAAYAELANPAIRNAGGRFIVRGVPFAALEAGLKERVLIVEFDNAEQAMAAYESEAYRAAVAALGAEAKRDVRIVEGLE
jgi:uncharacterized protein (DUF1330 family)